MLSIGVQLSAQATHNIMYRLAVFGLLRSRWRGAGRSLRQVQLAASLVECGSAVYGRLARGNQHQAIRIWRLRAPVQIRQQGVIRLDSARRMYLQGVTGFLIREDQRRGTERGGCKALTQNEFGLFLHFHWKDEVSRNC